MDSYSESLERKQDLKTGIIKFFNEQNIDLKGLKVLSARCSFGFHGGIMRELGADVWVNDNYLSKLKEQFADNRIIEGPIGKIPVQYHGTFDIVTVFSAFTPDDKNDFFRGIAKALKPGGKAIVGMSSLVNTLEYESALDLNFNNKDLVYNAKLEAPLNQFESENPKIFIVSEPRYIAPPIKKGF